MQAIHFLIFSGGIWLILLKFIFVVSFGVMVSKLSIKKWEKICWMLLALVFTWLAIIVFYLFRNSFILLRRERRKFNPRFKRDADETLKT